MAQYNNTITLNYSHSIPKDASMEIFEMNLASSNGTVFHRQHTSYLGLIDLLCKMQRNKTLWNTKVVINFPKNENIKRTRTIVSMIFEENPTLTTIEEFAKLINIFSKLTF